MSPAPGNGSHPAGARGVAGALAVFCASVFLLPARGADRGCYLRDAADQGWSGFARPDPNIYLPDDYLTVGTYGEP